MNDQFKAPPLQVNASNLIQWKTDAWQDARMVNWYSGRMVQNESTNYLKNIVEIETIKRYVLGPQVVDIGIGTGRAALPLVAEGYQLTGIDSSQAMLDETRNLAGDSPIELKVGDVCELPCDSHSFNSAIALNVLVHFPNWRTSLLEWKRVVKPGGRLIFDIHSRDHVVAACGLDSDCWPQALKRTEDTTDFAYYMSRVSVDELHAFADEAGLSIAAVIPYGAFFGGGNVNWFIHNELESKNHWKRLLSWFSQDQSLLELGVFMEEFVISRLTPRVTGRMFVVLDNKDDPVHNASMVASIKSCDAAIENGDFNSLRLHFSLTSEQFKAEFSQRLKPLRNRYFLYQLLCILSKRLPQIDLHYFLPNDVLDQFNSWSFNENVDLQVMELTRGWMEGADFRFKRGVDITLGSQYELARALLEKHFCIFSGEKR